MEICPLYALVHSADNLVANMQEYKENGQDLLIKTFLREKQMQIFMKTDG